MRAVFLEVALQSAERYLAAVSDILRRVDMDSVRHAAREISTALEAGGIVHAFGTGHSSLLAQELFYRAGGLVAINPILDPRLGFERGAIESTEFERDLGAAGELAAKAGFRSGDAGIVISNSGRNALPIEMALRMKAAGTAVIALTNLEQSKTGSSRHPSGKRLFEIADAVLDNHCPPGDAAIEIAGIPHPLGPVSTIVGAAILHAVILQAASWLAQKNLPPATFVSANLGSVTIEDLRRLTAPFENRIKYYRPAVREREGGGVA